MNVNRAFNPLSTEKSANITQEEIDKGKAEFFANGGRVTKLAPELAKDDLDCNHYNVVETPTTIRRNYANMYLTKTY